MAIFRMGLVGAGRMGKTHLRALARSDVLQVVAVADPVETARASVAVAPAGHAQRPRRDAACRWSGRGPRRRIQRHASRLHRRACRCGDAHICEKPCGLSSDQGREAAAIASAAKVPLQVAYWRRFVPSLKKLKTQILAGELGDLYLAACYQWDEQPPPAELPQPQRRDLHGHGGA